MLPVSKKIAIIAWLFFLLPLIVLAQPDVGPPRNLAPDTVEGIAWTVVGILNAVVVIIMILALIYFFYGLAKYISSAGSDESKGEGRNIMIYGIIALFVMSTVWGLVGLLRRTFSIGEGEAPSYQNLLIK